MPRTIGYARVSTEEQEPALQINALRQAGCCPIFCDHGASGADRDRVELAKALGTLETGDKLIVWKLDRLARSVSHLIQLLDDFGQRGIQFESLTEKIDTASAYGEFVFHILAGFAQMERRLISERTKAGMLNAKNNGVLLGRRRKLSGEQISLASKLLEEGFSICDIADLLGVSKSTISRRVLPACIDVV
ncbi:MAG: recombinase family protein [Pseudomonadaceae bacterium]|nr:recombinase family protein [Pseudomonadaceae bacterium]